jgi:hypothetical protein
MAKITFELVAASSRHTFNELVNERFNRGYKFVANMPIIVTPDVGPVGMQYSVAMLLEEAE